MTTWSTAAARCACAALHALGSIQQCLRSLKHRPPPCAFHRPGQPALPVLFALQVLYNVRDPILRDNVPVPQAVTRSSTAYDAPPPAGMGGMGRKLVQAGGMGGMGGGTASDGGAAKLPGYTVVRVLADNPGVW